MALILDGTTGASAVQDSSITDGKLSLTANSAQIKTALNASNGAPIYACRAWVNFNGTGTVAIRASGNVSSITDNGVGVYTMNFTTAMSAANYSVVAAGQQDNAATDFDSTGKVVSPQSLLVSSVKLCSGWFGNQRDFETVEVAVFR